MHNMFNYDQKRILASVVFYDAKPFYTEHTNSRKCINIYLCVSVLHCDISRYFYAVNTLNIDNSHHLKR